MHTLIRTVLLTIALSASLIRAQEPAPIPLQAVLVMKLLPFDIKLKGDITLYIMPGGPIEDELKKGVGKVFGTVTLKSVSSGAALPSEKPSALFIADEASAGKAIEYCRQNSVLCITGVPSLVGKGAALGVGVSSGKPAILLNINASKEEGVEWNPAILKIATLVN